MKLETKFAVGLPDLRHAYDVSFDPVSQRQLVKCTYLIVQYANAVRRQ